MAHCNERDILPRHDSAHVMGFKEMELMTGSMELCHVHAPQHLAATGQQQGDWSCAAGEEQWSGGRGNEAEEEAEEEAGVTAAEEVAALQAELAALKACFKDSVLVSKRHLAQLVARRPAEADRPSFAAGGWELPPPSQLPRMFRSRTEIGSHALATQGRAYCDAAQSCSCSCKARGVAVALAASPAEALSQRGGDSSREEQPLPPGLHLLPPQDEVMEAPAADTSLACRTPRTPPMMDTRRQFARGSADELLAAGSAEVELEEGFDGGGEGRLGLEEQGEEQVGCKDQGSGSSVQQLHSRDSDARRLSKELVMAQAEVAGLRQLVAQLRSGCGASEPELQGAGTRTPALLTLQVSTQDCKELLQVVRRVSSILEAQLVVAPCEALNGVSESAQHLELAWQEDVRMGTTVRAQKQQVLMSQGEPKSMPVTHDKATSTSETTSAEWSCTRSSVSHPSLDADVSAVADLRARYYESLADREHLNSELAMAKTMVARLQEMGVMYRKALSVALHRQVRM